MADRSTLPALVNAHTHSSYGPQFPGVIPSQTFESYMIDVFTRFSATEPPELARAFALMTGLENLSSGHAGLIDSTDVPMEEEYLYGVARAYEELGMYAWLFPNISDLPFLFYTAEAYDNFTQAIPTDNLPVQLRSMLETETDPFDELDSLSRLISGWQGSRTKIGLGLTNPVWCSDALLEAAGDTAKKLGVPICMHAEESPLQHEVHREQWGMSGIERLHRFGLLGPKTLLIHVVQVDDTDISILASTGTHVCHNPISNLKLRNGVAPVGKLIAAGVNVCLGTDGQSVSDVEDLFPAMKTVACLADMNGISSLSPPVETTVLDMATMNGYSLWFEGDFNRSWIDLGGSIGPYGHIWEMPSAMIDEVYIDGVPRLNRAREMIRSLDAVPLVKEWKRRMEEPDLVKKARTLADWVHSRAQEMLE